MRGKVRANPVAVLRALGLSTDADFDFLARAAFAQTEAAKQDPRYRDVVGREARDREYHDALEATQRELAELRQQVRARDAQASQDRAVEQYLDRTAKAVTEDTPIVGHLLSRNPEVSRQRLRQAAEYLNAQTGEVPEPAEVVRTLEEAALREPPTPDDRFLLAQLYEADGDWPKARERLQALAADEEANSAVLARYVRAIAEPDVLGE